MTPDLPKARGFLYLPLGGRWLGAAETEEGQYQVIPACRPTPVLGYAQSTLSQERDLEHILHIRRQGHFLLG